MKWLDHLMRKPVKDAQPRQEVDWMHMVIYDHVQYGYPGNFMSCGSYPDYSSPENFADITAKAKADVQRLNLNLQSAQVLDTIVQLKAYQLMTASLVETRLMHCREAKRCRADQLYQLENLRSSQQLIDEQLQQIDDEIRKLEQFK